MKIVFYSYLNLVIVEFSSLISHKREFKFLLSQKSNNEIDIIGRETDAQICPAFWKFMEKYLSDSKNFIY